MICWLCGFETTEATDAKAPVCKNGPCQTCIVVTEVDEEINQTMATLRRLIAKRRDRLDHHRPHATLINRLPVELKNHIFKFLLPSWDEWGEIPRTERTVMPSFLAAISVCKEWRSIALSSPSLWSILHISLGASFSSSRINDLILLSGTLPLTIHIQAAEDHDEERTRRVLTPILDALSQCSNRLQSLSLRVPFPILFGSQYHNAQYHRLTRLRIISVRSRDQFDQPLSLLNPTASPEKIDLCGLPLPLHQISWHRLTSAKLQCFDLEGVRQLFQHASQMTDCQILALKVAHGSMNFSLSPTTHRTLKTLIMRSAQEWGVVPMFLDSLTLPCLQELDTDEMELLNRLPAFVRRSSCPLTKLALFLDIEYESLDMQPLPGVTDLVVEALDEVRAVDSKKLLLEGYFPNLRHLTLRLQTFLYLWDMSVIPLLLDRKRRLTDGPGVEGRLDKFLVVNEGREADFDDMWNSDVGKELMKLDISLREDGFEFL